MDRFQKPHEPMALVLESATDVTGHSMIWELVLLDVELALEVFFLLPGRDPIVDSFLGNDGLFRFLGGANRKTRRYLDLSHRDPLADAGMRPR